MIELKGKYNTAKVFTDNIEQDAIGQIIKLLNQDFVSDSTIRIMPDTHAGSGCTIGTTMTITDKIVPNLVGVDIGCGMETVILKNTFLEVTALDKLIHEHIPSGFSVRKQAHKFINDIDLEKLHCKDFVNLTRAELSMGTLGGGNHFIEVAKDDDGLLYLIVHSGSRHLGKQIAEYYQEAAWDQIETSKNFAKNLIKQLKKEGREQEFDAMPNYVEKGLAYVTGKLFNEYLHDMAIAQKYAELNRKAIVKDILKLMKLKPLESFTTIHNYIDLDTKILRKGAISAKKSEKSIIPINMRDGSLICMGLGNKDWNYSAPHGAGRLMSRSKAKESITLSQFKKTMKGVYSTTVTKSTIDESPFAYKPIEAITDHIGDTVEIIKKITPIYNFKASE